MTRRMSEGGGWIWTAVLGQRWALPQVMAATALSHVLGLAVAIFLMAVYDRVLPAGAAGSLVALGAGVALAVGFDTVLRLLRARIADAAGLAVEREATLALAGALGAGMVALAGEVHENSRFVKEQGQWFYVDGDLKSQAKVGRNDPCPCGSGKKYKRCCA